MATSGTISQTIFDTNRVIDEALGACKLTPQQITPEMQETAKNQLYLYLSTLVTKGIPLWCIEKIILPIYRGNPSIVCPVGTVVPLNTNLRTIQRLTGSGSASASEGTAENAFDGDVDTSCTQTTPGGNITYQFSSDINPSIFGILPNSTGTWNIRVQTSDDGITYHTVYSNSELTVVTGEWFWFDLIEPTTVFESNYLNGISYVRLIATAPTILDVDEFVIANTPQEIPLSPINKDDYYNLPDKTFQGRPAEFWLDRQRDAPVLRLWPAPDLASTFRQITMLRQRNVMDVGSLTQTLDIPQRWYDAIVCELAYRMGRRRKEVDKDLLPILKEDAEEAKNLAWNGETDSSPVFLRPNLSAYTK